MEDLKENYWKEFNEFKQTCTPNLLKAIELVEKFYHCNDKRVIRLILEYENKWIVVVDNYKSESIGEKARTVDQYNYSMDPFYYQYYRNIEIIKKAKTLFCYNIKEEKEYNATESSKTTFDMENFKLIEDECKTNGFTQYLNNMIEKAVSQIITSDGQDPYWIDVSRQILKTLILIDLSSKNVEVDIPNILVNARNKIEEGLKNPTICNFIDYKGINTIIQNEKIFESTMKIIKNDLETMEKENYWKEFNEFKKTCTTELLKAIDYVEREEHCNSNLVITSIMEYEDKWIMNVGKIGYIMCGPHPIMIDKKNFKTEIMGYTPHNFEILDNAKKIFLFKY